MGLMVVVTKPAAMVVGMVVTVIVMCPE